MMGAALIPPIVMLAIVGMIALGIWPIGLLTNLMVLAVLAALTLGFVEWLERRKGRR